jgi:glyoxylase-like metal-dependent hydrolase (beta-lactamase superfamily II)
MLTLRKPLFAAQQSKAGQDLSDQVQQSVLQSTRAAASSAALQTTKITDTIFLLQSVGANVLALTGPDGELLIDSGMATAAPHLLDALKKLSPHPLKLLVNTSWLFDHTDGNAALHAAGAFIIAQENVRARLSATQKIPMLNLDLPSAPASALPQTTFSDSQKLYFDNDQLDLVHAPNASTDSDIFVHFVNANVIHAGELWFNDAYPIIETSSGGTINGMIQGVDQVLQLADDRTKIVPSHGKPGGKAALADYREMLADVANRVEKLKIAGQTLQQVAAAHVTADLDAKWGRGEMTPDMFLTAVYNTL